LKSLPKTNTLTGRSSTGADCRQCLQLLGQQCPHVASGEGAAMKHPVLNVGVHDSSCPRPGSRAPARQIVNFSVKGSPRKQERSKLLVAEPLGQVVNDHRDALINDG
jgi:hypothetical protein